MSGKCVWPVWHLWFEIAMQWFARGLAGDPNGTWLPHRKKANAWGTNHAGFFCKGFSLAKFFRCGMHWVNIDSVSCSFTYHKTSELPLTLKTKCQKICSRYFKRSEKLVVFHLPWGFNSGSFCGSHCYLVLVCPPLMLILLLGKLLQQLRPSTLNSRAWQTCVSPSMCLVLCG